MKPAMKAQLRVWVLIALLLASAVYPVVAHADLIITPSDDSWVRPGDTANKDGSGVRAAYSSLPFSASDTGYLRFSISSVYKDVGDETVLRLYVAVVGAGGPTVGTLALWSTGDDWNGGATGNGDETTLTSDTAPAAIAKLDTAPNVAVGSWVEFTGADLQTFINTERAGDDVVSFIVLWESCSTCSSVSDSITFEDLEGSRGTTNYPQLDARGPNLVDLRFFRAADSQVSWPLYAGLGALALIVGAGVVAGRRRASVR